jgi:hypothetical protein
MSECNKQVISLLKENDENEEETEETTDGEYENKSNQKGVDIEKIVKLIDKYGLVSKNELNVFVIAHLVPSFMPLANG